MLKRNYLNRVVFLLALSLSSCVSVKDLNKPICVEINPWKGACTMPITGEQFVVDETHKLEEKTWWEMRPAMLLMPASTWKAYKAWIIKMCKKTNKCGDEVTSWDRSIENIDKQLDNKLP